MNTRNGLREGWDDQRYEVVDRKILNFFKLQFNLYIYYLPILEIILSNLYIYIKISFLKIRIPNASLSRRRPITPIYNSSWRHRGSFSKSLRIYALIHCKSIIIKQIWKVKHWILFAILFILLLNDVLDLLSCLLIYWIHLFSH